MSRIADRACIHLETFLSAQRWQFDAVMGVTPGARREGRPTNLSRLADLIGAQNWIGARPRPALSLPRPSSSPAARACDIESFRCFRYLNEPSALQDTFREDTFGRSRFLVSDRSSLVGARMETAPASGGAGAAELPGRKPYRGAPGTDCQHDVSHAVPNSARNL